MTILAFLLALAFLVYQINQRRKLPSTSSYLRKSDGEWTSFEAIPARPTIQELFIFIPVFIFCTLMMLILTISVWSELPYDPVSPTVIWIFTLMPFCALMFVIWSSFRDTRPKSHRSPARFRVSPTMIEVEGQQFPKGDIHELRVLNAVDDNLSFAVYDGRSAINADGHAADAKRAAKIAYSLNLEEGGRSHVLAGGLTEATVNGLMHDVVKALDWEVSR